MVGRFTGAGKPTGGTLAPFAGALAGKRTARPGGIKNIGTRGVMPRMPRPSKALQGKVRNVFSTNKY